MLEAILCASRPFFVPPPGSAPLIDPARSSDLFAPTLASEVSFDKLIPRRVRSILVVASPYDAFSLEEGGASCSSLVIRSAKDEFSWISI